MSKEMSTKEALEYCVKVNKDIKQTIGADKYRDFCLIGYVGTKGVTKKGRSTYYYLYDKNPSLKHRLLGYFCHYILRY